MGYQVYFYILSILLLGENFSLAKVSKLKEKKNNISLVAPKPISKITIITPADVYDDYIKFIKKRSPLTIKDYRGTRRDIAELILVQKALYLGGHTKEISWGIGELSYKRIKRLIKQAKGTIHISGTSVWDVDFNKEDIFLSDAIVRKGEFEAGVYVKAESKNLLKYRVSKKGNDFKKLSFVSSKQWSVDWLTLKKFAPKALYDTPKWDNMVEMVYGGRADALLAPFQSGKNMELVVYKDKKKRKFLPIKGYKVGLAGSRHFVLTKIPGAQAILTKVNKGIRMLREKGEVVRAYKESGFFHRSTKSWKVINQD